MTFAARASPLAGGVFAAVVSMAACHVPATSTPTIANVTPVAPIPSASGPAVADAGTLEESLEPDWVEACRDGTPEHDAATAELSAVAQAVDALALSADPKPLALRIEQLDASRCFEIERVQNHLAIDHVDSALALKTLWKNGAEQSLAARLTWSKETGRWGYVASSPRKTFTSESAPGHPLAALLCPASAALSGSGPCGQETGGWKRRAERAFELRALAKRGAQDRPEHHASPTECTRRATAGPRDRAFVTFSECIRDAPVIGDALPLGVFRAATSGWLVLRGSRGGCSDLRAYDLATGAAHVATLCRGVLRRTIGKIPVDPLREAAWMMFLARLADHSVVTSAFAYQIPDGIPARAPRERSETIRLEGISTRGGRSTLTFQWVRQGKSVATGTIGWPDASNAADDYAIELLAIAEAALAPGPSAAPLPSIPWAARMDPKTRIGSIDGAFPAHDDPALTILEQEIAKPTPPRTR